MAAQVTSLHGRTTVVIATRNRALELQHTLAELRRLRPSPPVIVVDNASTDATVEVVDAVNEHGAWSPLIKRVALSRDLGCAARNVGAELASTPYIAFCDDDSWWEPGALERGEHVLDSHPTVGLLAARMVTMPDERDDPVSEGLECSPLGRRPDLPGVSVLGFPACAAMVRRDAYLEVGGFNKLLQFAGEEDLLAIDLSRHGWDLCYLPDLVVYRKPMRIRLHRGARLRREERNRILTAVMRRPVTHCARLVRKLLAETAHDPRNLALWVSLARRVPAAAWRRAPIAAELESRVRLVEAEAEHRARGGAERL
ncbi:glycosyltransferase family 2 protein [Rhodococcus sp. NPDC003322]